MVKKSFPSKVILLVSNLQSGTPKVSFLAPLTSFKRRYLLGPHLMKLAQFQLARSLIEHKFEKPKKETFVLRPRCIITHKVVH